MASPKIGFDFTSLQKKWSAGEWFKISEKGTFSAFLLLATIVWVLGALSKEYTLEIPVTINYENLPTDMIATSPLVEELFVTVKGEGRSLMRKNRSVRKSGVKLDLSKSGSSSRIAVTSLIPQIAEQFSGLVISGVQPDSLVMKFVEAQTKRVPVIAKHDLSFAKQFDLKEIKLAPDSVSLTGPMELVEDIVNWPTETISYADINSDKTGKVKLANLVEQGITFEQDEFAYEVQVDEYTEKVVEVNIEVVNLPENKKVILYPNKAELSFQLTVDNYNVIDESFFEIEADFGGKVPENDNQVPLKISTQSLEAKNARIDPKFVEFIIYK